MYLDIMAKLYDRYPDLIGIKDQIDGAYTMLKDCFQGGGKLLICGNGGSHADAEHIVGELMKSFCIKRPIDSELYDRISASVVNGREIADALEGTLPAISLGEDSALATAYLNDVGADNLYAQQVLGLGKTGDVLLCISTSGNATNCVNAAVVARAMGLGTIALTGRDGGRLRSIADLSIIVPRSETYLIQEAHLPIYHALCAALEEEFFG